MLPADVPRVLGAGARGLAAVEAQVLRPDLPERQRAEVAATGARVLLLGLLARHPDLPRHLATGTALASPLPAAETAGAARLAEAGYRLLPAADSTQWPRAMALLLDGRADEAADLLVLLDPHGGDDRALALAVRGLAERRRGDEGLATRLADAARRTPVRADVTDGLSLLLAGLGDPTVVRVATAAPAHQPTPPAAAPPVRRSSSPLRLVVPAALVAVLLGLLLVRIDLPGPSSAHDPRPGPPPGAAVVALADRAHLTAEGRRVFYAARPVLVSGAAAQARCRDVSDRPGDAWAGCYDSRAGIVVSAPADPRLARSTVQTATHELLHAVFDQLGDEERDRVTRLLAAEVCRLPRDAAVRKGIDTSSRRDERNRPSEEFAYLGTEVMPRGGFAPALEAVYARYLTDRAAVVRNSRRALAVLQDAWDEVGRLESRHVRRQAQYDLDRADYAQLRGLYENYRAQLRAGGDTSGIRVGWSTDGAPPVMRPLGEAVTVLSADLRRRAADLRSRRAALSQEAARAARLRADAQNLTAAARS